MIKDPIGFERIERRRRPRAARTLTTRASLLYHALDPLTLSAALILPHVFWAIALIFWDTFDHPSYAVLKSIAPAWAWAALNAGLAAGRFYAVATYGTVRPPARWLDRSTIYLSVAWWWCITAQFWLVGAGKTAMANTATFAIMAVFAGRGHLWGRGDD